MGFFNKVFGSNGEGNKNKEEMNNAFVKYQTKEENIKQTSANINLIVDSENWLFSEGLYENESLKKAIELGKEVRKIESYMEYDSDYEGVDLNLDVVKVVIEDFLRTIEPVHYFSFQGRAEEIYNQVKNTPEELLKYLIDEREEKLEEYFSKDPEKPDGQAALKIFELDLLLQKASGKELDAEEIKAYYTAFSDLTLAYYVSLLDKEREERLNYQEESEEN